MNILIVDDQPEQLRLLSQFLTEQGYRVRQAISGSVAIMGAQASPPDLILLDLMMPDLDGYQVCEELKNNPATRDIPIIFLSAVDEVFDKVKAFQAGARDYISKPFHFEEVLVRVKNQLEIKKSQSEIKKLNADLERRVQTRTAELQDTNQKLREEIERRKKIERQLLNQALYDNLTGLANRSLLMDRINQAIKDSHRDNQRKFALLFVDLDRFKIINDSLGHLIGDKVLIEIARRLQTHQRLNDTVARLGGDEFVVLLRDINSVDGAIKVAERIQMEIAKPMVIEQNEISLTSSIGIVINHNHSQESLTHEHADLVLRDADIAMYRAKSRGQGIFEIFDYSMQQKAIERLKLQNDLRQAIQREEFTIHYQPIVSIYNKRIQGFEALIRWHNSKSDLLILPTEFIPLAEENGAIFAIDLWMLEKACYQLSRWQKQWHGNIPLSVSVNLSGKHFSQFNSIKSNLITQIDRILAKTGLEGSSLKLEITEQICLENADLAQILLQQLRERNIKIFLDDFGKGYSSLSYLHEFPFDALKIDRSFINQMTQQPKKYEIVRAIINLAANLGMKVVAEGIETEEQFWQLKILGCDYGQGYWFARPMDAVYCYNLLNDGAEGSLLNGK